MPLILPAGRPPSSLGSNAEWALLAAGWLVGTMGLDNTYRSVHDPVCRRSCRLAFQIPFIFLVLPETLNLLGAASL